MGIRVFPQYAAVARSAAKQLAGLMALLWQAKRVRRLRFERENGLWDLEQNEAWSLLAASQLKSSRIAVKSGGLLFGFRPP